MRVPRSPALYKRAVTDLRATTMPSVLLFHAITRDRFDFDPFLPLLGGAKARAVDHLGHGDGPRAENYRLVDCINAAERELPDGPVVLYGHSWGAMVSLGLAARHGDRVRAIVLEDPPLFDSRQPRLDTTPWADGFRKLGRIMTGRGAEWSEADWQKAAAHWPSGHGSKTILEACGEAAVQRRGRQIAKLDPRVLEFMVADDLQDGFEVVSAMRAATCPVIIIAADRDQGSALAPEDVTLVGREPNVTIVEARSVGHYVREAQPELCAEVLLSALEGKFAPARPATV